MTLIRTSNRVYPNVFNQLFNRELLDFSNLGISADDATLPAVNILEDEHRILIEVAAPGLKKEDFQLQLDQNLLTVSSEVADENKESGDHYSRREFRYRFFRRQFNIPVEIINGEGIQATYQDGILLLTLPKRDELKPKPARSIEIQ